MRLLANVSCVCVEGRGLLIEGPPGSGKSSLALALIDRGAALVGDDGVAVEFQGDRLIAHPPPNIAGKLEIRGVGIIDLPARSATVSLVLHLGSAIDRLPECGVVIIEGKSVPRLQFSGADAITAVRAEWALRMHGLA